MELHYLKIFDTIASVGSFTKASETLHISQSSLSIQIKKLEEYLGLKLFNRIGNHISLNENGKILYECSQKIFEMIDNAEYQLLHKNEKMTGTIQIGASNTPGTYIIPNIIAEYRAQYPAVKVNLSIGNTTEIAHYISNGTYDFAVNGGSMVYHKDISVERLTEDELVLVTSPQSVYAKMDHIGFREIEEMDFVVHKTDSQLYTYYKNFTKQMKIPERVSITLGNVDAIKRSIIADIGVSLIPYSSVSLELQTGLLKKIEYDGVHLNYPYSLIYNRNKYISPAAEKFMDAVRRYMKK